VTIRLRLGRDVRQVGPVHKSHGFHLRQYTYLFAFVHCRNTVNEQWYEHVCSFSYKFSCKR